MESSEEAYCLSNPVALSKPLLALPLHLEEAIQTEVKSGYNPALQCLQHFNQVSAHLEIEQSKKVQKPEHKYNVQQMKMERRQEWLGMIQEGDYTIQEVFS